MSNIPEENNAALAKRRAIQELMRDKSITGAERNKRMQEIMMGKNVNHQLPSAEVDTALESLSDAAAATTTNSSSSSPPTRQMPRRGSSAKELIAKFESASKNDEPISSSINSSGKSSTIKSSEGSEYHKGATSSLYSRFGSNSNDSDSGVGGGRTSSNATMDEFEQKIKSKNALSTSSSSRSVESSPSDRDFEARLRRKASQESLDSSSQPSSKPGATSSASNSDFEARLRRKSQESIDGSSQSSGKPGAVNESKDSVAMSDFQSRILKKSTSNDSLGSRGSQRSSNSSGVEQRIMAKSALEKSTSRNNYAASSSSSIPRHHKRSNSQDSNSSSRSGRSYSHQLEQRIMEKTRNNGPGSTSRTMSNENASSQRFEQRILDKMGSRNNLTSDLNESSRSIDSNGSFENRLRTKLTSSRTLGLSREDESSAKISSEGEENNSQSRKRKAIKAIMQDESLTPSERNSRLQSVMRGDWIDNDADRQSSYGRQESDMSAEDDADKIRKRALEAKIACKMKKRGEEDGQLNGNDSSSEGGEEDDDYQDSRPSLFAVDDDSSRIHGQNSPSNQSHDGVGYGSLPLPEEHFVSDRQDPFPNHSSPLDNEEQMLHPGQIQDPNDENFGLAVASAVAHDDEPEYVVSTKQRLLYCCSFIYLVHRAYTFCFSLVQRD